MGDMKSVWRRGRQFLLVVGALVGSGVCLVILGSGSSTGCGPTAKGTGGSMIGGSTTGGTTTTTSSTGGTTTTSTVKEPTCTPPGTVSCSGTDFFASSPTESGCVPTGTTVPNSNIPPYDNPMGTCASVGDITVACTHSPNCSFCIKAGSAIPPGCTQQLPPDM